MKLLFCGLFTCALLFSGVLFTGCSSMSDPLVSEGNPQSPATMGAPHAANPSYADVARFRVGDAVTITFSGPPTPLDPHVETIKENGTITLDWKGTRSVSGLTAKTSNPGMRVTG